MEKAPEAPEPCLKIPENLQHKFRNKEAVLFMHAGFSRMRGHGNWNDVLRHFESVYEERGYLEPSDKGALKAWFATRKDYPRIAQLFQKTSRELYDRLMAETFNPTDVDSETEIPEYYRRLIHFPLAWIGTSNFDRALEDALRGRWESFTWRDRMDMEHVTQTGEQFIFHYNGVITRPYTLVHTLEEYRLRKGGEGADARLFLRRLFERHAVVFIGYNLNHHIFDEFDRLAREEWRMDLDWYALQPDPAPEQVIDQLEQRNLFVLPYPMEQVPGEPEGAEYKRARIQAHNQGINRWFDMLTEQLGLRNTPPVDMLPFVPSPPAAEFEISLHMLDKMPVALDEDAQRYYRGEQPSWNLVYQGHTARRPNTDEILHYLKTGDTLRAALLTGAGGEGKTTALKQLALDILEDPHTFGKCRVFYIQEPETAFVSLLRLLRRGKGDIAVFVDHAELLPRCKKLLSVAHSREGNTYMVLAARTNEWRREHPRNLGEEGRKLSQDGHFQRFSMRKIDRRCAMEIARLLLESKTVRNRSQEDLASELLDERHTGNFLLAAMLMVTQGKPLKGIIYSVIKNIHEYLDDSEALIRALAIVASLEVSEYKTGKVHYCSTRLFQEAYGSSWLNMKAQSDQLKGEVLLKFTITGERLQTRHPSIAAAICEILFHDNAAEFGLNELELHIQLVRAAAQIACHDSGALERTYTTVIPLIHRRRGDDFLKADQPERAAECYEAARILFRTATDHNKNDAPCWQAWAIMERGIEKSIGEYKPAEEPHSARWLFNKAVKADPKHAPSWQAWALLEQDSERRQGEYKSLKTRHSARWLFKKAVEADPRDIPSWRAWAIMEGEAGNKGAPDQEYTQAWLNERFKQLQT